MPINTPGQELKKVVQPLQKYLEDYGFHFEFFADTWYTGGEHDFAKMIFANKDRRVILKYYYHLEVFYAFPNYEVSHRDHMEQLGHERWKEILFNGYPAENTQVDIDNLLHDWSLFFSEIFKDDKLFGLTPAKTPLSRYQEQESVLGYTLSTKLNYARQAAEKAWKDKDYQSVINALKPLENLLTPSEKKKLQYCEKKIS